MDLLSKEGYDLMTRFEADCKDLGVRFQKEEKALWPKGHVYQNGDTNNFLAYRRGYALARLLGR